MQPQKILLFVLVNLLTVHLFASSAPIGVFDSGIGGMTVLDKILTMDLYDNVTHERKADGKPDFAKESFVYFGDQANMPYGDYSAAGKSEYLKKLILADADFLLSKKAKIVVIACNTATAWGLESVSEKTLKQGVHTVGVIGAGVQSALSLPEVRNASGTISIGVMATPGTIASGAYERTIISEAKKLGIKAKVNVISQGCAGLADVVEAGDAKAGEIAVANYRELKSKHSALADAGELKAIILGCTHYPFVLSSLSREAPSMIFVDPSLATAEHCYLNLLKDKKLSSEGEMNLSAFISVPAANLDKRFKDEAGNLTRACKYGRQLDDNTVWTEVKPYTLKEASDNAFIKQSLGAVWNLFKRGNRE
jgi:glutamate racemase